MSFVELAKGFYEHFGPQIDTLAWALVIYAGAPIANKLAELFKMLVEFLKAKTNEISVFKKTEIDDFIWDKISESSTVVKDTFVDIIKSRSPEKKLSIDDGKIAIEKGYRHFIDTISENQYATIKKMLANDSEEILEEIIKARIQAYVSKQKLSQNPQ